MSTQAPAAGVDDAQPVQIALPARIGAADVPGLHAALLEAIEAGSPVLLDGQAVERIDSAAAQWLIVCRTASSPLRPRLSASDALRDLLAIAGLNEETGRAA